MLVAALMFAVSLSGCGTVSERSGEISDVSADFSEVFNGARVSYLGPEGTYTEEAAEFFFENAGAFIPESTVDEAIEDVVKGVSDYAVIPQENTLGGAVTGYVDAFIRQKNMYVVGEVVLPIRQTLMGIPGTSQEDIRTVCSHAQGIIQSAEWRKEHLPNAQVKEMKSTAAAAKYVSESGDNSVVAVAAPGAAKLYGLSVLAENVQITDANKTRFYVLSASKLTGNAGKRAVFALSCEANRLDDIIIELHNAGFELVTLHDRPEGSKLGKYHYIIEVQSGKGITKDMKKNLNGISELDFRGEFEAREKP